MKIYFQGNYLNGKRVGKWNYFDNKGVQDTIVNYNE